MNLQSPLFDTVRIPSRFTVGRLIDGICRAHGIQPGALRQNRAKHPSNNILDLRREILVEARAAKYPPSAIANWFSHKNAEKVLQWMADFGVE